MAQINISSFNVRRLFSKGAFSAICLLVPSQLPKVLLLITMDNFHFCSFLPALCRTQSTTINGAGTTSSYGLFRPVTTNGRKVRVGRSNPARQKAGYVYFSDIPATLEVGESLLNHVENYRDIVQSLASSISISSEFRMSSALLGHFVFESHPGTSCSIRKHSTISPSISSSGTAHVEARYV